METKFNHTTSVLAATVSYILMVATNILANTLNLGGMTTGSVSDAYPNLFAPAPITFIIWFFIYVGLVMHTVFQLKWKQDDANVELSASLDKVGILFTASNILNILWIVCWHNQLIPLTMVLMVVLLLVLVRINLMLGKIEQGRKWYLFVRLPFAFYFGWISVATIANATTLFVSWGWSGWPFSESTWTAVVLLIGVGLVLLWGIRYRDAAYAVPFIWAYLGILIKHVSPTYFAQEHVLVLQTVQSSLVVLIAAFVFLIRTKKSAV